MSRIVNRPDTYLGGLGARMAIARNELGLSQARMADALGMSQRAYQSYETGKRSIVSIRRRPQRGQRARSRSISMSSCRFSIPNGVKAMTLSSPGP